MAIRYKVKPGDTLQMLGNPQAILQANPGIANLSVGQVIRLPQFSPMAPVGTPSTYLAPYKVRPEKTQGGYVAPIKQDTFPAPAVTPIVPINPLDSIFQAWLNPSGGNNPVNVSYNWRL